MVVDIVYKSTDELLDFISQERTENFSLLERIISNQTEQIILCGKKGVGKTTFLQYLHDKCNYIGSICLLNGNDKLSLEAIKTQLIHTLIAASPELQDQDLSSMMNSYQSHQQKIILALDNAMFLNDGLINQLLEYAIMNPVLRLIFVLTKPQVYLKHITDNGLDNCYFIEIPVLKKSQIGGYLYSLTKTSELDLLAEDINSSLVNKLFKQSRGIPRNILHVVEQRLLAQKRRFKKILYSYLLVAGILFIIAFDQLYVSYSLLESITNLLTEEHKIQESILETWFLQLQNFLYNL